MKIKILLSLFFLCGILNLFSQSKIDFRLNLTAGQCFTVITEITTEGTTTKQGKTSDLYSYMMMKNEYKMIKKVKNDMDIFVTKKDFSMDIQNASVKSKQSPALADEHNIYNPSTIFSLQLNRPYTAIISEQGKVLKIKMNNLLKDVTKKINAIENNESKQLYLSMLPSEQSLSDEIEKLTDFFPKTPVSIGDKWSIYEFFAETDTTYVIKGYRTLFEDGKSKKDTIMGFITEIFGTGSEDILIEIDKQTFLPHSLQIISSSDTEVISRTMAGNEISRMLKVATTTTSITIRICKDE